jgi:hypothetical protein
VVDSTCPFSISLPLIGDLSDLPISPRPHRLSSLLRGKGAPMTQKHGGREQRRGGGSQTGAGGAGTEGSQGELVRMSKVDGIHVIGRGCCHRGCCDGRTGGPARVSLRTGRRLCSLRCFWREECRRCWDGERHWDGGGSALPSTLPPNPPSASP